MCFFLCPIDTDKNYSIVGTENFNPWIQFSMVKQPVKSKKGEQHWKSISMK